MSLSKNPELPGFSTLFKGESSDITITFNALESYEDKFSSLPKTKEEFVKYKKKLFQTLLKAYIDF